MLPSADVKFNYEILPVEKAASARAAAERIRGRMQLAEESVIAVGKELIEQKKSLGHGNFLPWLEAEFQWSRDYANKFMHVAEAFGSNVDLGRHLSFKALHTLAAPSTPEPVRQEVLARADGGEKITAKEIERLKRQVAKAEELAAEKEAQRAAQESRAAIAAKQAGDAANRAMFAEADKQRLADELLTANEEIERLREPGVITLDPITQFNDVFVAAADEPTPWTDDDAQFLTIQAVWKNTSLAARVEFMKWAGLTSRGELAA